MISFNFNIRNPWSNTFKNLWCRAYNTPFKHKFIELEVTKDFTIVSFNFNWTVRQSHAGLDIELGLLGYCVHLNFYDNRHWDPVTKQWEVQYDSIGKTTVKFFRKDSEGKLVVVHTEECYNIFEADQLAIDMGYQYDSVEILQPEN